MYENVHAFLQPLLTWTTGPHAHLAGIPHSPVPRVPCSYYILTLSVIYFDLFLNSRTATWELFLKWMVESNRPTKLQNLA